MNLASSVSIYSGGPGSGCKGSNCGRPGGKTRMYKDRQKIEEIDKILKEAAQQTKVVTLEYQPSDEEKSKQYIVEPYSYRQQGDKFYFYGYDQVGKSIKAFNVKNILRVNPLGRTFKPRWPVEIGKKK